PSGEAGNDKAQEAEGSLMDNCVWQSKLWTAMKYLGFIWRVSRRMVWETATDTTTGLAAQMAYLLLFALAPGLLFLWHLLGLFGTDPAKLHGMFVLLKSFMPPDPKVQDILDTAVSSVVVTGSSGILANAGIILGIYFGTVFIATIFFSIGWILATKLFQIYVARYDRYNPTYLALASIIVLITWMYLTCLLLLLGGKLNAILRRERERVRGLTSPVSAPAARVT